MSKSIHKTIGPLIFRNKANSLVGKGTGILISPNLVLTGAQNIWNRKANSENDEFAFYPGQYGELKDKKRVERIFYPGKFQKK